MDRAMVMNYGSWKQNLQHSLNQMQQMEDGVSIFTLMCVCLYVCVSPVCPCQHVHTDFCIRQHDVSMKWGHV